ncbi:DUF4956 domain-containing protein [Spirochaeta dissipatitropha]
MESLFQSFATTGSVVGIHTIASLTISFLTGLAILMVYVLSNRYRKLDDSLTEVIPLLTVLMSVMMQIDNSVQAVTFFGIFGVLSIVRFRSALTDQKGITFILFSVILGVLVGTHQYLLSLVAFITLSIMVLSIPHILPSRNFFIARCKIKSDHIQKKRAIEEYIGSLGLRYKIVSTRGESAFRPNGKEKSPALELELEIRRPRGSDMSQIYIDFNEFASRSGINIQVYEHR